MNHLINQHYNGHRPDLWDSQTDVTFTITAPPRPEAIPQPFRVLDMEQLPAFESFEKPADRIIRQYKPNRDGLLDALKIGLIEVTFTNADGETKTMECTLREDLIPTEKRVKEDPNPAAAVTALREAVMHHTVKAAKQQDPNLIKVFAVDRDGWRSFRFERLIHIYIK